MTATIHNIEDRLNAMQPRDPIDPPGGGGDNGDMEARFFRIETKLEAVDVRLTRVETKVEAVDSSLTRVETKLDHIEKEVSQFKWWVVAQIVAGMLAVVGTGVAIQQMTVATFQAAAAQPQAQQQPPTPQPIIINVPSGNPKP